MDNIELIYDELKRNKIHIDKHALSFHINRILNQNKDIYSQIHILDIEQLYREINITNFGRTIAYLACVYLQSEDEETVRIKPYWEFWPLLFKYHFAKATK